MSIAEFIVDDPVFAAQCMGLPWDEFIDHDLRGFMKDSDTSTGFQDFEKCRKLPWARAFPTLLLDDEDSQGFLEGGELTTASGDDVLRANLENSHLVQQLIKSKVFTSIVIGGEVNRSEQSFKSVVVPLLKPFVQAGGLLIVQNGARWDTYREVFAEEIKWTSGRSARVFGVHEPNRQQVMRLFPEEAARTSHIRGKIASFYAKGALLKDVPDAEACFSSVEEGYPAKDNVVVAAKAIGKGFLLYIGTYNMCDSKMLIKDFLQENALSRKQFEINCTELGLWQAEAGLSAEDFQVQRPDFSDDEPYSGESNEPYSPGEGVEEKEKQEPAQDFKRQRVAWQ